MSTKKFSPVKKTGADEGLLFEALGPSNHNTRGGRETQYCEAVRLSRYYSELPQLEQEIQLGRLRYAGDP